MVLDDLDDEIIEWSLKMIHENRVDFDQWVCNIDGDLESAMDSWPMVVWYYDWSFYHLDLLMRKRVVSLLGLGSASIPTNDPNYDFETEYEQTLRRYLKCKKRSRERNRCNLVVYGMVLYALKRTGYKCLTANDDDCCDRDDGNCEFNKFMKQFRPLLLALIQGGDLETDFDYTDKPLEFVIESVKASVPVQES